MTEVTETVRSERGTSERIQNYLKEQGLTLADYKNMPIKKSTDPDDVDQKIRGNQFEWDFVPRSGIVTAIPVTRKVGIPNIVRRNFIDSDRVLYGIPIGIDPKHGDLIYQRVFVTGSRQFDLSKDRDREDFYTLIHTDAIRNGVHDLNGKGLLIIDNPEAEAEAKIRRFELSNDAAEIIRGYKDSEISELGILFRISPDQVPILIKDALYEIAKKDPKKFLRVYNNDNRKIQVILEKAIHYRVVTEGPEGILFGDVSMGLRVEEAIQYLKEKPNFLSSIEQRVHEHNSSSGAKPKASPKPGRRSIS